MKQVFYLLKSFIPNPINKGALKYAPDKI